MYWPFAALLIIIGTAISIYGFLLAYNGKIQDACESNQCLMSWMNPRYVQLSDPTSSTAQRHPLEYKYKMYLYREGGNFELKVPIDAKDARRRLGITSSSQPVLFVHGNAGSNEQVRSLGAAVHQIFHERLNGYGIESLDDGDVGYINLRDSASFLGRESNPAIFGSSPINASKAVQLDVFTIDFEEELSGLHGRLLQDQAEFVNFCIDAILKLYEEDGVQKKRKVLAFGHSMGGIVLRLSFMMPNHVKGSIDTMLTLSSPHRDHPFQIDTGTSALYQKMHDFWKKGLQRNDSEILQLAMVSIAGGFRDALIRTENTDLDGIVPPTHGFSISAYGIPGVRVSSDHLSIMWCRQLARVIGAVLMDLASVQESVGAKEIVPLKTRLDILKGRLISPIAEHYIAGNVLQFRDVEKTFDFDSRVGVLQVQEKRGFLGGLNTKTKTRALLFVPIKGHSLVLLSNTDKHSLKLFGTTANGRHIDMSHLIDILPFVRKQERHMEVYRAHYPAAMPRSIALIRTESLDPLSHLFLVIPEEHGSLRTFFEFFDDKAIHVNVNATFESMLARSAQSGFSTPSLVLTATNSVSHFAFSHLAREYSYVFNILQRPSMQKCWAERMLPVAYMYSHATAADNTRPLEERLFEDSRTFDVRFSQSDTTTRGFSVLTVNPCDERTDLSVDISWRGLLMQHFRTNALRMVSFVFVILLFAIAKLASTGFHGNISVLSALLFGSKWLAVQATVVAVIGELIGPQRLFFVPMLLEKTANNALQLLAPSLAGTTDIEFIGTIYYRTYSMHSHGWLLIVLDVLTALSVTVLFHLVIALLERVLRYTIGLPFIMFRSLGTSKRLAKLFWIVMGWVLIAFSATTLHSGCLVSLALLGLLLQTSFSKHNMLSSQSYSRRHMVLLFVLLVFVPLVAPSLVVWVKELLLASRMLPKRPSIIQILFSGVAAQKEYPMLGRVQEFLVSVDHAGSMWLAFPILLCLIAVSAGADGTIHMPFSKEENDKITTSQRTSITAGWSVVSLLCFACGVFVFVFCGFALYRVLPILSLVCAAIFLRLVVFLA